MKKEEKDFLGIKKSKEGKSVEQIRDEIYSIDDYQKDIKSDKKIIVKQNKDIDKLNKKIETLNKKVFNLGLNQAESGKKAVTLGELTKIIALAYEDKLPKQEIKALLKMDVKKLDCALGFLVKYNIIGEIVQGGVAFYGKGL